MQLSGLPAHHARFRPNATAVVFGETRLSHREFGARYQRISEVVILPAFPRNAAGKTLKRELRDPHWADQPRKI